MLSASLCTRETCNKYVSVRQHASAIRLATNCPRIDLTTAPSERERERETVAIRQRINLDVKTQPSKQTTTVRRPACRANSRAHDAASRTIDPGTKRATCRLKTAHGLIASSRVWCGAQCAVPHMNFTTHATPECVVPHAGGNMNARHNHCGTRKPFVDRTLSNSLALALESISCVVAH